MAIQLPDVGTGVPANKTGDSPWLAMKKVRENFNDQTNAASRLVGTGAEQVPLSKNIPSLLGTAATKNVGTEAGNVMEVGAFGFGTDVTGTILNTSTDSIGMRKTGTYNIAASSIYANPRWSSWGGHYAFTIGGLTSFWGAIIHGRKDSGIKEIYFRTGYLANFDDYRLYHDNNTTIVNGNLKPSSPVVKIHTDSLELNDDAERMGVTLNKRGVGDYLLQNTTGLRNDGGWRIELPQDVNGNPYFAVDYNELENNDIEVKTYKRIFDMSTFMFVPDLDNPVDIKEGRSIAIRFNDLPLDDTQTEV